MKILGREADVLYKAEDDALLVNLALRDDDCPEGKSELRRELCDGNCQNSYLSVLFRGNTIDMIGGITKDCFAGHVDEILCHKKGYGVTPEEHAALCKEVVNMHKSKIEKIIPKTTHAMFKHFYTQLNKEKNLPKCKTDISGKSISFKEQDLRTIDVYVNDEKIIKLIHSCCYLAHCTMKEIHADEVEAIRNNMEELKKGAIHSHYLLANQRKLY